jgi:hypothetical protein
LIFPYRRRTDHTEPGDANHPKLPLRLRAVGKRRVGPDPAVGKRVNRGDADR